MISGRASGVWRAALWNRTMEPGWTFEVTRRVISLAERSFQSRLSPSHIGSRGSRSKVLVVVYLLGCAFHIFYSHPRYPCRSAFPSRYKKAKAGIRISSFPLGAL